MVTYGGRRKLSVLDAGEMDVDSSGQTYSRGGNVGKIGRDTGGVHNIVEGQLVDEGTGLEEEGQRLQMVTPCQ